MYKVSFILLSIIIYFLAGLWLELNTTTKIAANNIVKSTPTPTKKIELPKVGLPLTLEIPKLQVKANIESIGVDEQGKMEVPADFNNVGWYSFGFKPGESGNSVLAGHYDTITGAPAVFYYISSLAPGDELIITDEKNRVYTFIVTSKEVYDYDKTPLKQLFIPDNKPKLNLITCAGVFDYTSRNYLQRTVIYSELIYISEPSI